MPSATAEVLPHPQEGIEAIPESLAAKEGTKGCPNETTVDGNDSVISAKDIEQNDRASSDVPKSPQGKRMPGESSASDAPEKTELGEAKKGNPSRKGRAKSTAKPTASGSELGGKPMLRAKSSSSELTKDETGKREKRMSAPVKPTEETKSEKSSPRMSPLRGKGSKRESSSSQKEAPATKDLLNRRPGAPTELNVAVKKDQHDKTATKDVKDHAKDNVKNANSVAVSPKIIELRRSESFSGSSNKTEENVQTPSRTSSKSPKPSKPSKRPPATPPRSRRWAMVRHAVKATPSVLPSPENVDQGLLERLDQKQSQLPPQTSTEFLLARLERQNELLDSDPKAVCIQSNNLKAHMDTLQSLVDNTDLTGETAPKKDRDDTVDWEFWTALIQDYTAVAGKYPHLLAARLQQGLPPKLRGVIWQAMCQASSTYLETMYSQLQSESSPYDRIIQRDLARTFPHVEMFKKEGGEGQTKLWNVLKAYSLYDPLVGYCQGLGFLVGPLLMNMEETQAFCVFVRLMESYDMRSMFTLNMEGLQLRLYQFSTLLSQILPEVHTHFQLHAVHAAMFASQWFLSLFAYTYPLPLVLRIYDVVFAEGAPETIMRVAIALLQKNEEYLLQLGEFEDLLDFLTTRLYMAYDEKPTGLIKDAMALSSVITKAKLDELSDNYVMELEEQKKRAEELVAVRFGGRFGRAQETEPKEEKKPEKAGRKRWSFANLQTTRQAAASLISQGEKPSQSDNETPSIQSSSRATNKESTALLHQQIEDLVNALSQMQKEHVDVTSQLVTIKMEKMDLVNEVEDLKTRLRGAEREKKRMSSASSMFSIDSAIASNDDETSSRRSSVGSSTGDPDVDDSDVTPRQSIDGSRAHRSSTGSFVTVSRASPTPSDDFTIPALDADICEELKDNPEAVATRLHAQKVQLTKENKSLTNCVEELESQVQEALQAQDALQQKNVWLRGEIERLDEEAAQAVYEQSTMEREVKELKELKIENATLEKEHKQLKTEMEALLVKLNGFDSDRPLPDSAAMRHISFRSFFTSASGKPALTRSKSEPGVPNDLTETTGEDSTVLQQVAENGVLVCNGDCEAARRAEELEHVLADIKLRLAESENEREDLSVQLEELRCLINGFTTDDIDIVPIPDMSTIPGTSPITPSGRPMSPSAHSAHEKHGSRGSLSGLFAA